jgi:replicative DNA helicase
VGLTTGNTGINQFYLALLDYERNTAENIVDPVAFRSWLDTETDLYTAIGGTTRVAELMEIILDLPLSSPEAITKLLRFQADKRKQMQSVQELVSITMKKEYKSEEDRELINRLTDEIRSIGRDIGYNPLDRLTTADDIADNIEDLWNLPDFISTPFPSLNKALGYTADAGLVRGTVNAVVAQSGLGKTTLVRSFMNYWVDVGYSVLFINYEEAPKIWNSALFTQITKQNIYQSARLSAVEKEHFTQLAKDKLREWGGRFMVEHDPETPYFDDMEQWVRDLVAYQGGQSPDAIILDTIQSMFKKGSNNSGARWQQYEEMMVRLEKLAKDLNTAIIITAQENKDREKERREVAQKGDVGGSLSIVQKCSIVMVITPKKLAGHDDSIDETIMQIQIPKNRITGGVFSLDPPLVKYNDNIKSYEAFELPDRSNYNADVVLSDILNDNGDFN